MVAKRRILTLALTLDHKIKTGRKETEAKREVRT